ncbi:MAG: hypothetical protein EBY28_20970 [Betaproteobacteria bacterium]|nr:hypothetical protein [Betaproteobacteria bacterium]
MAPAASRGEIFAVKSFENLLRPTRIEVASLMRLIRHPATEPCWSAGVHRFDNPDSKGAHALGTCYATSTIELAFAESVIHECERFVAESYELPAAAGLH